MSIKVSVKCLYNYNGKVWSEHNIAWACKVERDKRRHRIWTDKSYEKEMRETPKLDVKIIFKEITHKYRL
jgi:hypothetical protein